MRVIPAVDRKTEGRFRDERIAAHRLERRAGRIGRALVIARHNPDAVTGFDPDLRGPEHMTGRMQTQSDLANGQDLAVRHRLDHRIRTESDAKERRRGCGAEVRRASRARVIAMRVRDYCAIHRFPGIDVEAALGAPQAGRGFRQQRQETP